MSVCLAILYFSVLIFYEASLSDAHEIIGEYTSNSSVDSILEFLETHIDELQFAKYQDLVFMIGSEKSDKMTLALFLADAEIEAVETYPPSDNYVFVDRDGLLNEYPPNIVPELIPQLITDEKYGTEFYVLPEFRITNDVKIDLTAAHLRQRLLNFAKGIKFLFTLSFSSIKNVKRSMYDSRQEIRDLAKRATKLIKDVDKYTDAMSLVVTHCENNPDVTDKQQTDIVSSVLHYTIEDFVKDNSNPNVSREEVEWNKRCINFLEKLSLYKSGGTYPKMSVFRLANETGLVDDMQYLKNEKVEMKAIIRENTQYVHKKDNDFHYEVSSETKRRIYKIHNEVKRRLSDDVLNMNEDIKNIYLKMEKVIADIYVLHDLMKKAYEVVSKISTSDPKTFVEQIIAAANTLEIDISRDNTNNILKHIEILDFLTDLLNSDPLEVYRIKDGALELTTFLKESERWYEFLITLYDSLSEYKVQKKVKEYEKKIGYIMEQCGINENDERTVRDIGLKDFLQHIRIHIPSTVENILANSIKLERLSTVLQQTMYEYGTKFCSSDKLVVKGYNIKISDVINMTCPEKVTFKEIFALNKVFVDKDMEETGNQIQLVIIAPTWEIISLRRINLNGYNAKAHTPGKAAKGTIDAANGLTGSPGKPGGSAGCFLAVGDEFIDDEDLTININGGKGGVGQHGGDGIFLFT